MIPNFKPVDESQSIWVGGQPGDLSDWQQVKDKGCDNIIKLNGTDPDTDPGSAPDTMATDLGLSLYSVPISPLTQILNPIEAAKEIEAVIWFISPRTFVHCSHGQDRSRLAIAMWRHKVCGWPKDAAQAEMLANGFHEALLGLWVAWLGLQ